MICSNASCTGILHKSSFEKLDKSPPRQPPMKNKTQHPCPEADLIELVVTNQVIEKQERERIVRHVQRCPSCRIIFNELSRFHTIFNDELETPVCSPVFDLLNSIHLNDVEISGILLKPVEPLNGHKSMEYFAEIIISSEHQAVQKFQDITLNRGEIFLRAVRSRESGAATLYMLSLHERLYRKIRLQIGSEGKQFYSDGTGKIDVGKFDLSALEHQIVTVHLQD